MPSVERVDTLHVATETITFEDDGAVAAASQTTTTLTTSLGMKVISSRIEHSSRLLCRVTRGRGRGGQNITRGRGGQNIQRGGRGNRRGNNNNNSRNITKESLDTEIDKYMASTKLENDSVEMNAV